MTSREETIAEQVRVESNDNSHEVSYTIHCTFNARNITADQREAMAQLVRDNATQIQTFAVLIAGPTQAKTSLTKRSSMLGQKALDFGSAL